MNSRNEEDRYKRLFNNYLNFIRNSCRNFDEGDETEAIRIAMSFRVLFFDDYKENNGEKKNKSIITHLGVNRKELKFIDLLGTHGAKHSEKIILVFNPKAWQPLKYDNSENSYIHYISWNDWWNGVFSTIGFKPVTRFLLVKELANKDGGAHVDQEHKLDVSYKNYSDGYVIACGPERLPYRPDLHFLNVRTMADEILNSECIKEISEYCNK